MPDVLQGVIEQATKRPDRLAVSDQDRELTYAALLDEVARLGTGLKERGIFEGDRVALLLPSSVDFVVAALATLWIGAIFVPLADSDPLARLTTIIVDSSPAIIIAADQRNDSVAPKTALSESPIASYSDLLATRPARLEAINPSPRAAYMIYTSGTTGTPKGVLIGTAAFTAAVQAKTNAMGFSPDTRALGVSPFHFDGSYGTLFSTLYAGGTLVTRPRDALLFPRFFFRTIASENINYSSITPSYLRLLLASPQIDELGHLPLEVLTLGGEAVAATDLTALWSAAPKLRVFNCYGPTETTIAVTHQELTPAVIAKGPIPIGRPHQGVTFHLVDSDDGTIIREANQIGELYIGGSQLMDGYWRAPELTREVLRDDVVPGETLYRSGDLVYRDEHGRYVYVDRADRVIKRSGVRISLVELGESFRQLAAVTEAACATFDNEGELGIVAFVVADTSASVSVLRHAAGELLPVTMMPDRIELVRALPLSTSNKLDERRLLSEVGLRPFRVAKTHFASPA